MSGTTLSNNLSTTTMSATQASNETEKPKTGSSLDDYHGGLVALALLILICNVFAIQTYKRHEKIRRNCSNVMLLSLAISDLLVGLIYIPILVFCESQWYKYQPHSNVFVHTCRVNHLVGSFSGFSTIFHIIALTIEKYLAVLHPFQRLSVSTHSTYRKILITVWLLAFVFAVVPLFWMYDNPGKPSWLHKFHIYAIVQASIFLGLASVMLMFCYIRMFFQIHVKLSAHTQTGRVQTKARNDRKTILIFLMFFTIFVLGWCPWFFFNLKGKNAELVSMEVKDFLVSLRYAGAVLNPLLYSFIKNDYKNAVQSDVRGLCSRCPAPIRFQKLVQNNTFSRSSNNNTRRSTLTTGTGEIKLKRIEENYDGPAFGTSQVSGVHFSSLTDDTDL